MAIAARRTRRILLARTLACVPHALKARRSRRAKRAPRARRAAARRWARGRHELTACCALRPVLREADTMGVSCLLSESFCVCVCVCAVLVVVFGLPLRVA